MPGFCLSNLSKPSKLRNYDDSRCIQNKFCYKDWDIQRNTLNKFMDDKIFFEDENFIIILEGVVYNKSDLIKKCNCPDWKTAILSLIENDSMFFNSLEGSVSGSVFYKKTNKIVVFTGILGEKAIFFYHQNGKFIAGSQLNYVTDALKSNGIILEANITALKQFMGYGYYLDDSTCVLNVLRLYPGNYLEYSVDSDTLTVDRYHSFEREYGSENLSENEYITHLDKAFSETLEQIALKDKEYGYINLIDISGGADSRMIAYTAKKIGIENVLMDCYAQSGCADAKTSQKIATELGYDYIFRTLDNASSLMNIDENILMTNGATVYYAITGGKQLLEMLDRCHFGLEYTGLLGDVRDGSMVTSRCDGDIEENIFRCSGYLKLGEDFEFPQKMHSVFSIHKNDCFWFYARGMLFGMTSYFVRQNFVEVATPFGSKKFLDVYLSIPWNLRVKKFLLRKWMINLYPQAAEHQYSDLGISFKDTISFVGKVKYFFVRVRRKILRSLKRFPQGMNDIQYWFDHNELFHSYIETYYSDNICVCKKDKDIQILVERLYNSTNVFDKLLAVTVLGLYRCYIN